MRIGRKLNGAPTRRRFLHLAAAAGAVALCGTGRALAASVHRWEGSAMGADATITLGGLSGPESEALIEECLAEIARLEAEFSLYSEGSSLLRLNRDGYLDNPAPEFVELLDIARQVSDASKGKFDPTVQPLWSAYTTERPAQGEIEAAKALVGFEHVAWNPAHISYARPRMAMTFNGIAQGFVTDKIADLLRAKGLTSVLVNLGEYRAIGLHPDARPWQVGIQDPREAHGLADIVELADDAIATSGGYGALIGHEPGRNHLFDPKSGESAERYLSVSVLHPRAVIADGLSTAFSFLSESEIRDAARVFTGTRVLLIRNDGSLARI